ncbi:glycosyltransferase family 2 protein [[Ruminococcus] lactaris]|uniref:Glycosyltransferase family 2 protein n=1 Tax=[Ruminococcus] lactaris TaxID=46228 RepID=A0A3E4LIP9_9FIRM|nr:glycosyltransferase family 2 protein [[Ruminococcus] lactaris]RGK37409.1 glycosyltransferase family 2 protein [[Ruminococcus] lactaris]
MPKVSVIIPIYNVKNYVKKSIESAINQTEKDIQIVLVDDGSSDGSGKICDQYAKMDDRIKVIHKENGGLSSARNTGTAFAVGKYVMFLDGDDYLKENAIERVLQVMEEYPSDFIQFMYQEVRDGDIPVIQTKFNKQYQVHTSKELFENLYKLGGVGASGATKLIKRELALQIPFENILHEDEMWCTRAFQKALNATYISDELYCYVMRNDSIIHSSFNRKKLDKFKVCETRIEVLNRLGYERLLSLEYNRLFGNILTLYREAKQANDSVALQEIKKEFINSQKNILTKANLTRKNKVIFKLMSINYQFIKLYYLYWKMKGF